MQNPVAKKLADGIRHAKNRNALLELAKNAVFRLSLAHSSMIYPITLGIVVSAFLSLVTESCSAAPLAANEELRLPSGNVAKILSVSRIEYAKGVVALMVRYQTALSMEEAKAVSAEADEVWKFAEKDVERAGLAEAIITPSHTERGLLLTTSREANFIFEKGADGKWTRLTRSDFAAE